MSASSLLASYTRIALRKLVKERSYSVINIAGLTIGIACCLILGLYLHSELSYDQHHEKKDRIYRIINELTINGDATYAAVTSTQLALVLAEQNPVIEYATRFRNVPNAQSLMRTNDNQALYWEDVYLTDNATFKIFSHDVLYGNPDTALIDPNSIAVSETFARQYFGDRNPIGETIFTDAYTYRIDLVFADLPDNTHLKYDVLISYNQSPILDSAERIEELWSINAYTYVLLPENFTDADFQTLTEEFYERNMRPMVEQLNINASAKFTLEPISYIHLQSSTDFDLPRGNIFYIYAFSAIALFVLIVACINYINLATARSIGRAKEVGMRKVLGASRSQLLGQFIGESVIYVLVALALAVFVSWIAIAFTPITTLLDSPLPLSVLFSPLVLIGLIFSAIALGLLSGLYPAIYLSAIPPVAAFRGAQGNGRQGASTRQALVLMQFVISIAVIASTLLMLSQMQFVQSKPLGFQPDNRLVLRVSGADQIERLPAFLNELRQTNGVISVAVTEDLPGEQPSINALQVENKQGSYEQMTVNTMDMGPEVIETLGMQLLQGRDFDINRSNDPRRTAIVNQSLVRQMGWSNPIGRRIQQFGTDDNPVIEIIGVVEDFHMLGLQQAITPLAIFYRPADFSEYTEAQRRSYSELVIIQIEPSATNSVLNDLQNQWSQFDPSHPLTFTFLQEDLRELYGSEQRLMGLVGSFAGLCIFISCLGLFGLSAFNTAKRTKEIGIRKVLGASTISIIALLFQNILALLAIASLLASAISFWAISKWLEGFYYRIDLLGANLMIFGFAALIAITVAFTTMAMQSLRTIQASPNLALRYE